MLVSDVWQGLVPTVAFCLSLLASPAIASKPKNAILLSSVQSITLRAGKQTTHRRVPAVPQLTCVSSPEVCALHEIDIMRCTNEGTSYDAEDIQWSCTANLPPELKLGSTDVICEGYSSKNDPYVLKGSCAVEYRTVLTDYGRDRFPDLAKSNAPGRIATFAFYVIFISTLLFIIWSAWRSVDVVRPTGPPRRPGWGPGGGGGDWGDDDPPSPYYPPKPPSAGPQQQEGWRPGFWTGLAGGAAAGYAGWPQQQQ